MAIVQTDKALNLATRVVAASELLMRAMEQLVALKDEKESAGIDFVAFDTDYAATEGLKHVDGARLNNVLSSTAAVQTFLTTNFHDDIFQAARR